MKAFIEGVPSVVWAVLIVVGMAVAQEYLPSTYAEVAVLVAVVILRSLAVSVSDLDTIIEIAQKLQERLRAAYTAPERSLGEPQPAPMPSSTVPPEARIDLQAMQRSKVTRILIG